MSDGAMPQQGAIVGGWICFFLGVGVMFASLWAFWFYVPLLLVAFILSVAAMSQRRVLGGVILLLTTLAVPPVEWFVLAAKRTHDFAENVAEKLSPEQRANYELGRRMVGDAEKPASKPVPVVVNATPGPEPRPMAPASAPAETEVEAYDRRLSRAMAVGADGLRVTELNADTVPLVFAARSEAPVERETIARYLVGYPWGALDEFARHDFVEHLGEVMAQWKGRTRENELFRVTASLELGEYDFDRHAFPIPLGAELTEVLEPQPQLVARYKYVEAPRRKIGGDAGLLGLYRIGFARQSVDMLPVSLEEAKTLAPALRASGRKAEVSLVGTVGRCVEDGGYRVVYLTVSEMTMTLPQSGQSVSVRVAAPAVPGAGRPPEPRRPRADTEPPAPSASGASTTPDQPAMRAESAAPAAVVAVPAPEVMTLSPEAVVSDVLDTDLRVMARNFQKQYAGKRIRFSETVVRKNPKEQLLVFKGGGFVTTAYDVQARLDDEQVPGFDNVDVGTRLSIEGTLDRLVPPALGIGSNSIRIRDARIVSGKSAARSASAAPGSPAAGNACEVVNVPAGDTLNVRSAPAMNAAAAFALGNGQVVQIRGEAVFNGDTEWVPVSFENQTGWVRSKYLRRQGP